MNRRRQSEGDAFLVGVCAGLALCLVLLVIVPAIQAVFS